MRRLSRYGSAALLLLALFALSMGARLDHDEHQFVAAGALLARDGLWPYLDFPYFHVPNLVLVDAALFRLGAPLLLTARLVSAAAGAGVVALVWAGVRRAMRGAGAGHVASWAPAGAVAVVAGSPLFTGTTGRAWNHDVPTFLTLAAFLLVTGARGTGPRTVALRVASAGLLLGLAVGTRLTFAPVVLAFAAIVATAPGRSPRSRAGLLATFFAAVGVALSPSWVLFARAPARFWFGNFVYPSLNTRFHADIGYPRAMGAVGKIAYTFTDLLVQPATLLLTAAVAASLVFVIRPRSLGRGDAGGAPGPHPRRREVLELSAIVALLLVGSFAPSPLFRVYFFEPLPFAVLLVAEALAGAPRAAAEAATNARRWLVRLSVGSAVVAVAAGLPTYVTHAANPFRPAAWVPMRVHEAGRALVALVGASDGGGTRVLTYAPIFPLEGGADIYPELATGPFAARAASLLSEADEARFGVADGEDWGTLLRARPACAVLTGLERSLDDALLAALPRPELRRHTLTCAGKELHVDVWVSISRRADDGRPALSRATDQR